MATAELSTGDISTILGAIIGAGSALVGVILTSIVAIIVGNRTAKYQNKQRDKEIRLEKLEELYVLYNKKETQVTSIYDAYFKCLRLQISFNEFLTIRTGQSHFSETEEQRLFMLLHVYFPKFSDKDDKVSETKWKLIHSLRNPNDGPIDLRSLVHLNQAFLSACRDTRASICVEGKWMF